MFWKRKSEKPPLVAYRQECNRGAEAVLRVSGIEFDRASQLQQALIGTFVFGMIYAEGMARSLEPTEVHALALCVFQDTLHYTSEAAAQGVQACIDATAPGAHDTMRAIMLRGVDGHAQYSKGDLGGLTKNLRDVLQQFEKNG